MIPEKLGHLGSDKAAGVRGRANRKSQRSGTNEVEPGADRAGIQSWAISNEGAATPRNVVTARHCKKLANGSHFNDD